MQIINENGLHELKKVVDKLQGIRINNRNDIFSDNSNKNKHSTIDAYSILIKYLP